jgi:L-alanine-DL-glutamate epimerase-like enolase superfamily enzyme
MANAQVATMANTQVATMANTQVATMANAQVANVPRAELCRTTCPPEYNRNCQTTTITSKVEEGDDI